MATFAVDYVATRPQWGQMTSLLGASIILLLTAAVTAISGLLAVFVLKSVSRTDEPAFAGFCFTVGTMLAGSRMWVETGDWSIPNKAAAVVGLGLGLILIWRMRVRPERAKKDGAHL